MNVFSPIWALFHFPYCKLLVFVAMASLNKLYAQEEKFQVSISSGLSQPVGAFKKPDPTNLFTYNPDGSNPEFIGFLKEGNGYAKPGYFINGGVLFHVRSFLNLGASLGYTHNPVNSDPASKHMTEVFTKYSWFHDFPGFVINSNPYQTYQLKIDMLLKKQWDKLALHAGPSFGMAFMNFPDYSFRTYSFQDYTTEPNRTFQRMGGVQKINGFLIGMKSTVNYTLNPKLKLGLFFEYLSSNFDYKIELEYLESPTYSSWGPFEDTVNYRVIQLGFQFMVSI